MLGEKRPALPAPLVFGGSLGLDFVAHVLAAPADARIRSGSQKSYSSRWPQSSQGTDSAVHAGLRLGSQVLLMLFIPLETVFERNLESAVTATPPQTSPEDFCHSSVEPDGIAPVPDALAG